MNNACIIQEKMTHCQSNARKSPRQSSNKSEMNTNHQSCSLRVRIKFPSSWSTVFAFRQLGTNPNATKRQVIETPYAVSHTEP